MKKFTPHLLILIVGFLSLAFMASNALAQVRCEHLHQLSKKLHKQTIDVDCKFCVCEKMEVYRIKHKIKASILANCLCDETDDDQCGLEHGHPDSTTGDFKKQPCVWGDPSKGIPGDSIFTANITRVVKYCKDGDNQGSDQPNMPRAGYHQGTWRIDDSLTGCKLASGKLNGVDGVDPSFERPYELTDRDRHDTLPCDNNNDRPNNPGPDSCDGAECYIPGWQVGCLTGSTTDLFFRYQCPPPGSFTQTEVSNIDKCPEIVGCEDHGIDNVIEDDRGKQICVDSADEQWKVKACYSGGNPIFARNPCDQWDDDWCVRLEGVITIKACDNF